MPKMKKAAFIKTAFHSWRSRADYSSALACTHALVNLHSLCSFRFRTVRILMFSKKKSQLVTSRLFTFFRGPERIRTAVGAFAELSLATRPRDHLVSKFQSSAFKIRVPNFRDFPTGNINQNAVFPAQKYKKHF
jgi:hypothetical protein